MKRIVSLLSLLCVLTFVPAALAQDDLTGRPIADGVIAAVSHTDITAPFSGTLAAFDLQSGDAVTAGDTLFTYVDNVAYATEDGAVTGVFAQPGDDAAAVTARYGGVVGVEPTAAYRVEATTDGASSDNENKILHLGETLYLKTVSGTRYEGTGRVTGVSGKAYSVDLLTGDFKLNALVNLYRDKGYAGDSCVGRGQVKKRDPLLTQGAGRVSAVYVKEGDTVHLGDPLAAFVSADAAPGASLGEVKSAVTGVLSAVAVAPGQQVWKGELLCRVEETDAIEAVVDVDETDLGNLKVGDAVPVTLDMNEDNVLSGTVTQISGLGVTRQNAAYFTVHISVPAGSGPLGASVSAYLPAKS